MSDTARKINRFFKTATKAELDAVESKILLSERQGKIFTMFYIRRKGIQFIADSLCVSVSVVNRELKSIRIKIAGCL